ncbi:MAG: aminopeptidase P N-terminal domain-containing protein [Gemmatimonas sp.]
MRPALFRRALRAATGTSLLMASPVVAAAVVPATATAQSDTAITRAELDARRSAFAQRIGNGVVVAFGGRALVHDFSTFYQLAAFRYLTELNEPDHAFVMVVRDKIPSTTLFLTRLDPRTAFY